MLTGLARESLNPVKKLFPCLLILEKGLIFCSKHAHPQTANPSLLTPPREFFTFNLFMLQTAAGSLGGR